MKHKTLAIVMAMIITLTMAAPVLAGPSQPDTPQPIYRGDTIDIGPVLRAQEPKEMAELEAMAAAAGIDSSLLQVQATTAYTIGDKLRWWAFDFVDPMHKNFWSSYFETEYEVRAVTENCEVWVQTDLSYYNTDGTPNPLHPDSKDPEYVTQARIDHLANACNDAIQPTVVGFFGAYANRDGTDGWEAFFNSLFGTTLSEVDGDGDRVVVLVSNVRDDMFYDPIHNTSFIGGVNSSTMNLYGDRNFITLDSRQWNDRVGPSGHPTRAYGFDSTLAHELQHMIHRDHSNAPDTWINEGLSEFSEWLVGYNTSENLAGRTTWQTWPENSLTLWGDQNADNDPPNTAEILADYQLVGSFMLYTSGRIGGAYTDTAKLNQTYSSYGLLGFNDWLSDTAATNPAAVGLTFDDIFEGFRADMLYGGYTDDVQPTANWNSNFIGEYESPLEQSGGPATSAVYLGLLRDNLDREGYDWPGVPPFGTDFIEVCWSAPISNTAVWPVVFDGEEQPAPTAWEPITATDIYSPTAGDVADDALYSGHSNLTDNFLVLGPVTVGADDALSFNHYYNIEDEWDFGFVQVTTDTTGMTGWTSLDVTGTMTVTDPSAHPIIVANVPGFYGFSGGWITSTYPLSETYGGETILLAFRYSTDWGSAGSVGGYPAGWAVDNVTIGTTTLTDGAINGRSIQEVRDAGNRFDVEFLTWGDGDAVTVTNVYTVSLNANQWGTLDLTNIAHTDAGFDEPGERGVFMVSLRQDIHTDLIGGGILAAYADYTLVGLPPSICTSDVDAYGNTHAGAGYVYAGQVVTAAVHADNLGSSPNITTTGPAMVYVGIEVPADTTYAVGSATAGAAYTDDLSTVAGTFPAVAGVYWTGLVTRSEDLEAGFTTDADLMDGDTITVNVHFASDATAIPDQHFVDNDTVNVVSAFGLSGLGADIDPVWPGTEARFTASVINMSPVSKTIQLVADHPADTIYVPGTGVVTGTTQVTVTQMVAPYAEAGATDFTFRWLLGPTYDFGDEVTSEMVLTDLATGETFDLSATADVDAAATIYLPVVMRNSTGGTLVIP